MYDDPGDIDRNGIPDAIQRDPVVVPEEPAPFSLYPPEPAGLPGIDAPIEATAEPGHERADQQQQAREFELLGTTVSETIKAIGEGLSSVARKE